jgi:hypothetical protein
MNTSIESSELNRSFIVAQQIPVAQERVGSQICGTMNKMLAAAIALKTAADLASNHGTEIVCAGATLATGLGYLYQGDILSGGALTLASVKQAINVWQAMNPTSDLSGLINDAQAGVSMVKTLEEANSESFKVVDKNLEIIHKNVKKMNDRMEKIKSIATEGQQDVEDLKAQAEESYKVAQAQFSTAQKDFEEGRKKFKKANKIFIDVLEKFDKLLVNAQKSDLNNKESTKKALNKFIKIAEKLQTKCQKAQATLLEGNALMDQGLEALDVARDHEKEAYGQSMVAMERAKTKFELIDALAKVKREYEKKVENTQEELDHIQARNQDINALLNEMSDDLREADHLSTENFGNLSMFFGTIPGAVAGFTTFGCLGAVGGGMGGGALVHNRKAIFHKVDDLINGKIAYIDENPTRVELIKVKFQNRSTGWFNRFIRKATQSYTSGRVDIKIRDQIVSLDFNLNKDHKIKKQDEFKLQQLLGKKVYSGEITAQECLDILAELTNKHIDRGPRNRPQKGLIAEKSPYFNELKRICAKMVANEQKTAEELAEEARSAAMEPSPATAEV